MLWTNEHFQYLLHETLEHTSSHLDALDDGSLHHVSNGALWARFHKRAPSRFGFGHAILRIPLTFSSSGFLRRDAEIRLAV